VSGGIAINTPEYLISPAAEELSNTAWREVVDGVVLTSPTPFVGHQLAVGGLFHALRLPCPTDLYVLPAPVDYQPDVSNSVRPDIAVVRRCDVDLQGPLTRPPLLAIEVSSEATRRRDLTLKLEMYQHCRVPAYWVFDPSSPSLTMFDLIEDVYRRTTRLVGEQEMVVEWPYPIRLCPTELATG